MASIMMHVFSYLSFILILQCLSTVVLIPGAAALGATDTITWGGDVSRSGYQSNHNMDPSVVGSANFGQIFKAALPGNFNSIGPEQIFSQPLVYTGSDGVQYIYVATTQNNIYKLDAKTGAIKAQRNLHVPFLTADLDGCVDINPTVGVTATGVIDPSTNIWYFTAKTYSQGFQNGNFGPGSPPGRPNGRYYLHAVYTDSLNEVPGFPTALENTVFRNNPNRMFTGGIHHQRPALLLANNYIYAGFASHCVKFNFTGAIFGFNKNTGAIVEAFATEGGPEPNTTPGGGVWMSGGGLSYDGRGSIFFATGNGYASQLKNTPVPGRQPPSALEEAAVNAKINDNGTLSIVDFFMPWEKVQLDGADKDLGTTPLELLPSDTFSCQNVKRMGVVTGKSGKTYWLDLDNLGGYQMGPNKLDAVPQVYQNENSVYAGVGVYPLEGGYVYINPIGYKSHVFKFSCEGSGNPVFTLVANTPQPNAAILGVGHGTTTSLNGRPGTGLYWISDVQGLNLRIYNAVPPPGGGDLTPVNSFNIDGITKFTRPVFGDGRVYLGTTMGYLYGLGSPVNLPLNCSSVDFGKVAVNNISSSMAVTCVANTGTTVTNITLPAVSSFKLGGFPTVPVTLTFGQRLTFNATFSPKSVGLLSSDVILTTTNAQTGFSTNTPVTLRGTANSANAMLQISPNTMSFNVVVGNQPGGVNQSSILSNQGDSQLKITRIQYSLVGSKGPYISPNSTDSGDQVGAFVFTNIPTTIPGNDARSININFNPSRPGGDAVFLNVVSTGGNASLDVVASGATNPVALIEFQDYRDSSKWVPLMPGALFSFGTVLESQTTKLSLRVTNNGTGDAAPLSITVSKPPFGVPGIIGTVNNIDLAEGTSIAAGQSANASLFCSVPNSQVNLPSYNGSAQWTINTGDRTLGKQFLNFSCQATSEQVGPLLPNGTAQFGYVGCFKENNPGRQLAINAYGDGNNSNGRCTTACAAAGFVFAGTQYQRECWCGNAIPLQKDNENDCNFQCTGIANQTCGGDGYFHNSSHMSLFADSTQFNGQFESSPPHIVQSVGRFNFIGCYAESSGKALSGKVTNTNNMTVEYCGALCSGYKYFGAEFGAECYCGNAINTATASLAATSRCSMTCKGSNSEYCGAGNFMQMYQLDEVSASSVSTTVSSSASGSNAAASTQVSASATATASYIYQGCYNETHDRRALLGVGTTSPQMSVEYCASYCSSYTYFGVEYASECYCANSVYIQSFNQSDASGCSMNCAGNPMQKCGGPDFLNVYRLNNTGSTTRTSLTSTTSGSVSASGTSTSSPSGPTVVPSAGPFSSLGCYSEINGRALNQQSVANNSMTVELCASFCAGYSFFGVEYGQECYCGNILPSASGPLNAGRCSMTCAADSTELCGGSNAINIYQNKNATSSTSSSTSASSPTSTDAIVVVAVPGFKSVGCYNEIPGRALSGPSFSNSSNSVEFCASFCSLFQYFGVEYASECYCGNTLAASAAPVDSGCSMRCSGNTTEICGGPNRLNMYQAAGAAGTSTSVSSETNSQNSTSGATGGGSTATVTTTTTSTSSSMSREGGGSSSSTNTAASSATSSTGSTSSSSVSASSATSSSLTSRLTLDISTTASSNPASSPTRFSAASSTATSRSTTTTTSSTAGSNSNGNTDPRASSSSSSVSAGPTPLASISSYAYQGCYTEASSGRALAALTYTNATSMSPSLCSSLCAQYAWFGLEYGRECYCGPYPRAGSTNITSAAQASSDCSAACVGDARLTCGGSNRLTMYRSRASDKISADPAVQTVGIAPWQYYGCVADSSAPGGRRALDRVLTSDSMSVEACLKTAVDGGYGWAGLEFGKECWMGQMLRSGTKNATEANQCGTACGGNPGQLCGGASRLNVYFRSISN